MPERKPIRSGRIPFVPSQAWLTDHPPLIINPEIATALDLNCAIMIQQVHYWMQKSQIVLDGKRWVYNTYDQWQEQFPWWSAKTIKRTMLKLEKLGIVSSDKQKKSDWDQTKSYTLNYVRLEQIRKEWVEGTSPKDPDNLSPSSGQVCVDRKGSAVPNDGDNLSRTPVGTETTSETTAAKPADAAAAVAPLGKAWTPADPDDEPFALEQSDLFPSPPTHASPAPPPFVMADPTAPPPRLAPVDAGTDIAVAAAQLRGAGVAVHVADRLAVQHTLENVRGAIAKAQRKAVRDKSVNVPGYIVATLQNGAPLALPDGVRNRDYGGAAARADHREACDRDSAKRSAERAAAEAGQQTDRQYLDAYAQQHGAAAMDGVAAQVKAEILTGRDVAGVKANDFTAKRLMTAAGWSGNRLWESLMVGWLKQQKGG